MESGVMTDTGSSSAAVSRQYVELRTGEPYANLLQQQQRFVQALGQHFNIDPACILPAAGTTGAIESVRNHIRKTSERSAPLAYMLTPEYWRAREAFCGLGFRILDAPTQQHNFFIDERKIGVEVTDAAADLLYLSLPNNPTGATFRPEDLIERVPERTAIVLDFTLPAVEINLRTVLPVLQRRFAGRNNLYFVGSSSKSHGTAEQRIGWLICCRRADAEALREENRNVISVSAIQKGLESLEQPAPAFAKIPHSFAILRAGEAQGAYELVRPPRMVESGYVLIKVAGEPEKVRERLREENIRVMWG